MLFSHNYKMPVWSSFVLKPKRVSERAFIFNCFGSVSIVPVKQPLHLFLHSEIWKQKKCRYQTMAERKEHSLSEAHDKGFAFLSFVACVCLSWFLCTSLGGIGGLCSVNVAVPAQLTVYVYIICIQSCVVHWEKNNGYLNMFEITRFTNCFWIIIFYTSWVCKYASTIELHCSLCLVLTMDSVWSYF